MIAIKTIEEKNYDIVNPLKTGYIYVELLDWIERQGGAYYCNVRYYIPISEAEELTIKTKSINITEEKFNTLYLAVDGSIPSELTPYQRRELRKKLALLAYVTNDFLPDEEGNPTEYLICGTLPEDWEIV